MRTYSDYSVVTCGRTCVGTQAGARVYIKALRKALDEKGCSATKIVACDGHSYGDITGALPSNSSSAPLPSPRATDGGNAHDSAQR